MDKIPEMSTWVLKEACERPCKVSVKKEHSGKNECVYVRESASGLLHKHAEFYFTFVK